MILFIPAAGLLAATLVLLLCYPMSVKTGRLAALYPVDSAHTLSCLLPKSVAYQLLASGLPIRPATFRILRIAASLCGGVNINT